MRHSDEKLPEEMLDIHLPVLFACTLLVSVLNICANGCAVACLLFADFKLSRFSLSLSLSAFSPIPPVMLPIRTNT